MDQTLTPEQAHENVIRAKQQMQDAELAMLRVRSRQNNGEDSRMARIARFNRIVNQDLVSPVSDEELQTQYGEKSRYKLIQNTRTDRPEMPHKLVDPEVIKRSGSFNRDNRPIGECWECGKDIFSSTEIHTKEADNQDRFCDYNCENKYDYKTQNGTEIEDDYIPSWNEYLDKGYDKNYAPLNAVRANYRDKAIKKKLAQKEAERQKWEDGQRARREDEKRVKKPEKRLQTESKYKGMTEGQLDKASGKMTFKEATEKRKQEAKLGF